MTVEITLHCPTCHAVQTIETSRPSDAGDTDADIAYDVERKMRHFLNEHVRYHETPTESGRRVTQMTLAQIIDALHGEKPNGET